MPAKIPRIITRREGSKVFVLDKFRKTREQIEKERDLVSKEKVSKPKNYKPFRISDFAKEVVIEHTNTLLERTRQLIASGKTPIIILPGTAMRIAGHLFGSALIRAFPEVYVPLRKYLFGGVLHLYVPSNSWERNVTPVPDYIKRIVSKVNDPVLLIVDESESGSTFNTLKHSFNKAFPKIEVKTHGVSERPLNVGTIYARKEFETEPGEKIIYKGVGGVLKRHTLRKGKDLPNVIPARPIDYAMPDGESKFWHEQELKKYFSVLGRQLGAKFRAEIMLKHKPEVR